MRRTSLALAAGCAAALALTTSACGAGGGGGGGGGSDSINVLMVNNPQMLALQKHVGEFEKKTGIKVHFTVKPENDMRNQAAQDFQNQSGQFDVATLSNFEIPIYAKKGWLWSLDDIDAYKKDTSFDQSDIFPSMTKALSSDDKLYGEPFYGESSFLMYRKDVLAKAGVTMPEHPTWDQVAAAAAKVDGAEKGMKGICLRGLAGWGENVAPFTTVVNTFGGTWFDKDWNAQVDAQPFKDAATFYTNLVKEHGEAGAAQAGFAECLTALTQSKVAMWYDATSAAGSLEAPDSPVKGKIGYAQAPVKETDASGWLYTWAWAIQKKSSKQDDAWKFISWASGKDYLKTVGESDGWSTVPAGARESLYKNADYLKAAGPFADATLTALEAADPDDPGTQPRPAPGIQFVDVPEFTDLGTSFGQDLSAVIAGQKSVDAALAAGQKAATAVGKKYQGS
ncbi:sugar ABC transporter substrate-binding protein [Luteimicrobium xylanilyticum]|uniref:Sugar ABC transporter substrate-binding protein n=1 Tax=Luteimicrobium xylanilyticum TaxID=1133546 RepID=A0A5P9QBJ0_9MICO|nr:sugar ABC transporter substrate-binding protein [Luteimicrobium xylanilyticum]QFU98821.1 hypothetical protein KDY119_02341 [Luteimicrobium xylanilyticum]